MSRGYFTLGEASGVLEAQANVAVGVYTVSVEARDERSNRATAVATVRLAPNGMFMMGGGNSGSFKDVWASADGKNWAKVADAGWTGRTYHQAVGYQGRLYVMGGTEGGSTGRKNDVWSSADGVIWSKETDANWTARDQHQAVVHQGRLYVLSGTEGGSTGRRNDVWSWAEGESSWSAVTLTAGWQAREGTQVVSHNGRLYMLGGNTGSVANDIWSSVDGANWSFEGVAQWAGRVLHQAVLHNGRLYVLGGSDGSPRNDVWSWAEGESGWREEKASNDAFWSKRLAFQALSHDGLLYVMGGQDNNSTRFRDVWSSADGVSWTKVANANWSQ